MKIIESINKRVDDLVGIFSPEHAYNRVRYRAARAAYEAAKPSRLRKMGVDNSNGDYVVGAAGVNLRGYARQLEQNYDIAKGVLDVLVNNTVGATGINREPLPRTKDGDLHKDFAKELLVAWNDWVLNPEVTWELDYASMERLACRTFFRDGELLVQLLDGAVPGLQHGTRVQISLELIEADHLPFDLDDERRQITQGVERNAWGRPRAYHIYKTHPGDNKIIFDFNTKRVPAENMLHPKLAQRIRQARGVSVFAAVMRRLEDLKDYEESERIAARVAAAMTGYIKRGTFEDWRAPDEGDDDRTFGMKPGMIFDKLQPGEDIGTLDSNRPSGLLTPFHDAMLRFTATGTGTGYSSISRNYNGTYSAQRQELVETWGNYQVMTNLWVSMFSRPVWKRFIDAALAGRQIQLPADLDMRTLYDADFRGPAMPWIDPKKEADANKTLERAGYKSAQQIIRDRGGNPENVRGQIKDWRERNRDDELVFDSDPANDKQNSSEGPASAGLSDSVDEEQ